MTGHTKPTTSHVLHLLLSLLTLGLWILIWIIVGISNSQEKPRCVACKTFFNESKLKKAKAQRAEQARVAHVHHQQTNQPPPKKPCPFCAELIMAAAIKCKECGSMLDEGS